MNDSIIKMKKIIFIFLSLPITLLAQEDNPQSARGGWAIHIGAGIMYGGNFGILGERQFILKEKFRISPFIASGVAEGGTDSVSNKKYYWFGSALGANFEYGKKHRIIFGPHFVGNNLIGNSIEIKKNALAGASFIIGYKGTANFGLIWLVYIGDIYLQDPYIDSKKYFHSSHMGLGIGYKF